jgi:anti-sigma regulatory factor (Ser/Thr protein kinase)
VAPDTGVQKDHKPLALCNTDRRGETFRVATAERAAVSFDRAGSAPDEHQSADSSSWACAYPGGPDDIARAREFARSFVGALTTGVDPAFERDVILAVSELVTNAVRHAPGPLRLVLTAHTGAILIEVSDTSRALPAARPSSRAGQGGYGLRMLAAMSGELSAQADERGKTVGLRLPRPASQW